MYSRDSDAPRPRSLTRTRHDRDVLAGLAYGLGGPAWIMYAAIVPAVIAVLPAYERWGAASTRGSGGHGRSKQAAQQPLVEDVTEAGAVAVAAQLDAIVEPCERVSGLGT